ncbi:MAG: outer membrane lipoprotein-sorting protein [Spirochaetia bacterium]|nr:outer membrane lipoprotein-sorting protein [Spirochaetia bacterium]
MKILKYIAVLFIAAVITQTAMANSLTGYQIIEKAVNRPAPKTQKATLTMTLVSSSGSKRVREIDQFTNDDSKVEKKIMFFQKPADVRGTSFMNFSYSGDKADDQWIYLPALKKVKRISSDSKGDYFMGSDFTYDDLGDRNPKDDNHEILREETLNGEECYVVSSTPKDKDYMYSKTITWVIKNKWIGLKKIFYDENGDLLKTLNVIDYKNIDGYWIQTIVKMINEKTKHETIMNLSNIKVNDSVPNSYFSERIMKRGIK